MNTSTSTNETTNNDAPDAVKMIEVRTVEQTIADNSKTEQVIARRRNTEKNPVATENRVRSIIIPELSVEGVPSKFESIVLQALRDTAAAQLTSIWDENAQLREVPAAVWSVDSLLLFAAKKAESQRLTKENLGDWFDASKLAAHIMGKGNAKMLADWRGRVTSLAATVLDINDGQCDVTIATLGKFEDDSESPIGRQLIRKLVARKAKIASQMAEVQLESIE